MTDLEEIDELRRTIGQPGMTAGEFSVLLPDRLRGPYWRSKIDQFFREQGIDPDAEDGPTDTTTRGCQP